MILRAVTKQALMVAAGLTAFGCGQPEQKYEPRGAPSGAKANIGPVPNLPQKPIKVGEDYTVWGASYYLRSRVHAAEVVGKRLNLTGYIVKTNLPDAPPCAVHKTGKADPEGCKAPVPTFWIADTKDADLKDAIKVMGWASNFAQIYDAVEKYKKEEKETDKSKLEPQVDNFWGVKLPRPLPAKGGKLTVTGTYSTTFTRATSSAEADPIQGIMTYDEIKWLEEPPEKATLPGMDDK
jgi:hypothetical protein